MFILRKNRYRSVIICVVTMPRSKYGLLKWILKEIEASDLGPDVGKILRFLETESY